jgi:NADPH:quinone reductase
MRAVVLEDFGRWGVDDVAEPDPPDAAEVLIRVRASSLNPSDWKLGDGAFRHFYDYRFPMRLGRDYLGTIEAAGPDVSRFAIGETVFGHPPVAYLGVRGTFAEWIVLPEKSCMAAKPPALKDLQAAVLPLAVLTAMDCVDFVSPRPNDRVLVVGSTGGVGVATIQLLVMRGAEVVATGLPEEEAFLAGLGVTATVDFRQGTAAGVASRYPDGVDHLVDLAGGDEEFRAVVQLVKERGRIATTLSRGEGDLIPPGVAGRNAYTPHDAALLERAGRLVAAGDLTMPIAKTCSLEELPNALHSLRDHPVRGKVAVQVGGE